MKKVFSNTITRNLFVALLLLWSNGLVAQEINNPDPTVTKFPLQEIPLLAKVNPTFPMDEFAGTMANTVVAPKPGETSEFQLLKEIANAEADALRIGGISESILKITALNPPQLGNNFAGNAANNVPNDNALTISNGGKILCGTNSLVRAYNEAGGSPIMATSMSNFSTQAGLGNAIKFDPKVTYDPVNDRFILVFMYGDSPTNSKAVICFSETNDPSGAYNVYAVNGNVGGGVWTDFPQIGISTTELFVSGNLFAGTSSQGSAIWQIELADGYAGTPLTTQVYQTGFFSLHPVQGGNQLFGPHFYFLASDNSLASRDIAVHKITNTIAGGGVLNSPITLESDISYTIPPDANQKNTTRKLQTNDCRVQSSYFQNNRINFTLNTGFNGKPSVYYGNIFVSPLGLNFSSCRAAVITDPSKELAYGAVAYAGTAGTSGNNNSLVMFNFAGTANFASNGAVYVTDDYEISPILVCKAGAGVVGVQNPWRWGDYADLAERCNNPGEAWVGGSYGNGSSGTGTYISQIFTPLPLANDHASTRPEGELTVFPNPTTEMVEFNFPVSAAGFYTVQVLDMNGKSIKTLVERNLKPGEARLAFNAEPLTPGVYTVIVSGDEGIIFSEKLLKENQ